MVSPTPSVAGFLAFLRGPAGIPAAALPDASPYVQTAYDVAVAIVNLALADVPGPIYALAVYNLGTDNAINWAPDPVITDPNDPNYQYFTKLRDSLKISAFVAGVVSSASDESTSVGLYTPEALKQLTMMNLQQLKTPFGRQYLSFAMEYGDVWGLT